ncbi:hypothetical protein AAFF_G00289060 [Aldrovandia affinis]|uniref:Uncharacterized protein n=1 Tax=Aldrovandia affinis TaxID=143900 RepID=A0AAD7RC94_9TELE|nr:hypothetical protein AAFF_G00289060 [Aldrovandia affinis]
MRSVSRDEALGTLWKRLAGVQRGHRPGGRVEGRWQHVAYRLPRGAHVQTDAFARGSASWLNGGGRRFLWCVAVCWTEGCQSDRQAAA